MLLLTRRIGESIIINDNIIVTPLHRSGNQVKLGIEAPDDISIHREEIWKKINAGIHHETKEVNGNE